MPAVRCSWAGIGAAPASCSPDSVVGSSTRASGFPAAWVISRSATSSGTAPPAASVSSARAAPPVSGVSATAGDAVGCERAALAVAGGEHDRDPVRAQAPGGDQHRVGGGLVEPLRVVEDAQHGRVLGGLGQHRQGRERRQERLDRDVVRLAERGPQRSGLRRREPVEDAEDGTQQPVQRGERQRRLGLHALGAQHPHVARRRSRRGPRAARTSPRPGSPCSSSVPARPPRASSRSVARRARSSSRPCSTSPTLRARRAVGRRLVRTTSGPGPLRSSPRCRNPAIPPGRPATDAPTLSEYRHSAAPDERTQPADPRPCRRPDHRSPDARR